MHACVNRIVQWITPCVAQSLLREGHSHPQHWLHSAAVLVHSDRRIPLRWRACTGDAWMLPRWPVEDVWAHQGRFLAGRDVQQHNCRVGVLQLATLQLLSMGIGCLYFTFSLLAFTHTHTVSMPDYCNIHPKECTSRVFISYATSQQYLLPHLTKTSMYSYIRAHTANYFYNYTIRCITHTVATLGKSTHIRVVDSECNT